MRIDLKNISKKFGSFIALDKVSLEIKSGELVALLGPSGSGKTTLLRIISGLEFPDSGSLVLDGPKADKGVGFVFQHYSLFKHMTVFENIAFGLRVRPKATRPSENEIRSRVDRLLDLVHLKGLHTRYPNQLSGGQRQRVALARALAIEPAMLLLDEPFGALDARVRKELRRWMRKLHDEIHVTSVFVTHDQEEAMEVADRIVVMNSGIIEQVGTPDEVWHAPANAFVYSFLGNYNEFEGWIDHRDELHLLERLISAKVLSKLEESDNGANGFPEMKLPDGTPVVKVFSRPHETEILLEQKPYDSVIGKIVHINPAGPLIKIEVERKDEELLLVELDQEKFNELKLQNRQTVYIRPKKYRIFQT